MAFGSLVFSQEKYNVKTYIKMKPDYRKFPKEGRVLFPGFFTEDKIFVTYIQNFDDLHNIRYSSDVVLVISQEGKKDTHLKLKETYFDLHRGIFLAKVPEYNGPTLKIGTLKDSNESNLLFYNKVSDLSQVNIPLEKDLRGMEYQSLPPREIALERKLDLVYVNDNLKPSSNKTPTQLKVVPNQNQSSKTHSHYGFMAHHNPVFNYGSAFEPAQGLPLVNKNRSVAQGVFLQKISGNYLHVLDGTALKEIIRQSKDKFNVYHPSQLNENYNIIISNYSQNNSIKLNKYYAKDDSLRKLLQSFYPTLYNEDLEYYDVHKQNVDALMKIPLMDQDISFLYQLSEFLSSENRHEDESESLLLEASERGHLISSYEAIKIGLKKIIERDDISSNALDSVMDGILIPFADETYFPPAQFLAANVIFLVRKKAIPVDSSVLHERLYKDIRLEFLRNAHLQGYALASFDFAELIKNKYPRLSKEIFLELSKKNYGDAQRELFRVKDCQSFFNKI